MKANLSVIVVNFNKKQQEIEECFQSLRDQTVPPEEIIFVDDCSTPSPVYKGVLSIVLPQNMGVAYARKIGVRMSTCKLLLFVDADDKLAPDFIEKCGKKIRGKFQEGADIVYTDVLTFGEVDRNVLHESPDEITPKDLMGKTIAIRVTSLMRREVYETVGGFRELPIFEDWDFWLRAMANGFTFARASTILWYRQSKNSRGSKSLDLREKVHAQITAPYRVEGNKLWVKNATK